MESRRRASSIVVALVLLVHGVALRGSFVWDDHLLRSDLRHKLATPWRALLAPTGAFYRPLSTLLSLLDERVWGEHAAGWHATNLALHALAAVLLLLVLRRCVEGAAAAEAALAATLLFAVHPATAEVVAWIAARGDAVALVCGLAATLALDAGVEATGARAWAWRIGGGLLLLLAILGKETGVVWVAAAPAVCVALRPGKARRVALRTALPAAAAAAALYLVARLAALGALFPVHDATPRAIAGSNAAAFAGAWGFYAVQALFPVRYLAYVKDPPADPLTFAVGALAFAGLAAGIVRAWRRKNWTTALGLLWAVVALLPALFTTFERVSAAAVADRQLYPALPGLALAAVEPLQRLLRSGWRTRTFVAGGVVLGGAALLAGTRDLVWHDDHRLWESVLARAPESRLAWGNLGLLDLEAGRTDAAAEEFRRAVDSPERGTFLRVESAAHLATIEAGRGQFDDARALLARVAGDRADAAGTSQLRLAQGMVALLQSQQKTGRDAGPLLGEAATRLVEAEKLYPADPVPPFYLGLTLERLGERVDALAAFDRSIAASRDYEAPISPRARTERAQLEAAIRAESDPARRAYDEGRALQLQGRCAEAVQRYAIASQLNPAAPGPRMHAAECGAAPQP